MLEGGEASGKSTQAAILAESLDALLSREPGGTGVGERLRTLLLEPGLAPLSDRTEALLMLAARAQHVAEVVEPTLKEGRDVVCDRFSASTLAYQGYGRGLDVDELATMSDWAASGLRADRTILLVVPAALAASRGLARGAPDRMEAEGAAFFAAVERGFALLAAEDPLTWRVVDGAGSLAEVAERVRTAASE